LSLYSFYKHTTEKSTKSTSIQDFVIFPDDGCHVLPVPFLIAVHANHCRSSLRQNSVLCYHSVDIVGAVYFYLRLSF